jgi:hypothetical protein
VKGCDLTCTYVHQGDILPVVESINTNFDPDEGKITVKSNAVNLLIHKKSNAI